MDESWGPWIEHDGKGCPCVGEMVHLVYDFVEGDNPPGSPIGEKIAIAGARGGRSWDWRNSRFCARIIRYRIRKPRGLTILENLIADLPAPVGPKVDA